MKKLLLITCCLMLLNFIEPIKAIVEVSFLDEDSFDRTIALYLAEHRYLDIFEIPNYTNPSSGIAQSYLYYTYINGFYFHYIRQQKGRKVFQSPKINLIAPRAIMTNKEATYTAT